VACLFKDIDSYVKVVKVKCIFCNMEIVKNGTRTVKIFLIAKVR
jgi:hypothetical protein